MACLWKTDGLLSLIWLTYYSQNEDQSHSVIISSLTQFVSEMSFFWGSHCGSKIHTSYVFRPAVCLDHTSFVTIKRDHKQTEKWQHCFVYVINAKDSCIHTSLAIHCIYKWQMIICTVDSILRVSQPFSGVFRSSRVAYNTIPTLSHFNDIVLRAHPGLLWTEWKQLCCTSAHIEMRRLFITHINQLSVTDRTVQELWMELVWEVIRL